jgi:hypothetical protein
MISLKNIWTISQYEGKVLWRNWFFRILAIAGIGFLTIFNIALFSEADSPDWGGLSNSWMMPYSSMVLISIPLVAAVVFLASGLIKKDKKVDTNEVFFVRAITNLDYVFGKALALFKLFFLLHLVFMAISIIFNVTNPYATFQPMAYVMYPMLTSFPTIVFTTGISFLLVTLIKNQPITIVLLLGLTGVQLIYYFDQFSNILDFMAFRLPMFTSEISGFANMEFALLQRSFYLLTGIAFLFLTAFFLDRLSSHRALHFSTAGIGALLLILSSFIMIRLWDMRQDPIELRQEMMAVNAEWATVPNVEIKSNAIDLVLLENELAATSEMIVKNNTGQPLNQIYFTLNPGLAVADVVINNQPAEITRDLQMISIKSTPAIQPGEEKKVVIRYHGDILEAVAHLEVDQKRYESAVDYIMHSLQKKYAFQQPDYFLFTRDVLWYPETRVGYNREHSIKEQTSFVDFELKVKIPEGLVAISQGEPTIEGLTYHFRPEYDLPQISLTVGDYVKKEITVDSVTYALYHYPDHDYFADHLNLLSDTLSYLITDIANEFEDAQKLKYPFRRLQFVEAPLLFTAYNKIYEDQQAFLQPEIVFYPEEGADIRQFDFRNQLKDMSKQSASKNQVLTDKQKQANVFNDLVKRVFTKQIAADYVFDGFNEDRPDYAIFPNYYTFNSGIVSPDWALLNRSISTYLRNEKQAQTDYSRNINGISFTEECNDLMRESSMEEILSQEEFSKIQKSVSLKSQYLFSYLGQMVGENEFKTFLYEWVNSHQHQLTTYEQFRQALLSNFSLDIDPVIKKVFNETAQPAFEILDIKKFEVVDGDRKRYQVLIEVENTGENDGVIDIRFNRDKDWADEDNASVVNDEENALIGRVSVIRQGERKLFGFVLDEKPEDITFNTIISRNIPSVITLPVGPLTKRQGGDLFEGERAITDIKTNDQYEVIVDNEDPGFSSFSPIKPTYLKAYLDSRKKTEQKYFGSWDRSYSKWLATTGSGFYGSVIRSAHFTRAGNGEKRVTWTPVLKEEGFYDLYVYMQGKNQNEYLGQNSEGKQFYYHYIINHADGEDNITYNISNAEPGWNFLGSYYFNQKGGGITLTDECDLRTVYADAIKWVKQ